ncbi:MAG: hypothetical protein M1829_004519 [Trizodia sp. TS-e1964]|nr:MAG: hypothetical protein M1829_004519 [Trizodia sp. TS-e1964]
MLTVALGFVLNPTPSNPLHSGLLLSYPEPVASASTPLQYGKGPLDLAFVAFYIVVFSFTREFIMQRLIRPLAIYLGVHRPAKQIRFMEQMYTALYMGIFGPYGLYVMSKTPVWYFNTRSMYEGFPHKTHSAIFKAYYLLQAAYWAQQAIVIILRLEKPRKDFRELVLHHIITVSLIALSYRFHFTYCGLAVYITHDISDFFLAISKSLNYIDSPIIGPFFAIFVCVWVYMRHYINIRILLSILIEFPTVGPFTMDWEAQQYKCRLSQVITFSLLATLQAVNLFWTFLILRIAKNIVFNSAFVDERSEDEDEEEVLEKVEPVVSAEGTKLLVNVVEEKHAEEIDDNENDDDYEKVSASETKKGQ